MYQRCFTRNIKYLVAIACLSLTLVSCGKTQPPEAKEAIAAFQKIDSRVELGINLKDYLDQVADAKLALEKYKALPNAEQKIVADLNLALIAHISALDFWNCKIENSSDISIAQCQTQKLEDLADKYSEVKSYVEELKNKNPEHLNGSVFYYIEDNRVLSPIWNEAKKETTLAQNVLNM